MSAFDILRAAEKFQDLDIALEGSSPSDLPFVQNKCVQELQEATRKADALIATEALKSLGDVFLQKGNISGDDADFGKAASMYSVALVSCSHLGQVQTLLHRVKYARKLIERVSRSKQHGGPNLYRREDQEEVRLDPQKSLNIPRVADTFQTRLANLTEESRLIAGYINLLVESVATSDVLAEVEALKGLGDEFLRRGGVSRDMADFTRASHLYSAGLARCQDTDNRQALLHRVGYAARLRDEEVKGNYKTFRGKATRVQNLFTSDNIDDDEGLVQTEQDEKSTESSYDEYYEAGVNALRSRDLEAAEQNFASALKLVHGRQETITKEAVCLCGLGDVLVAKGNKTADGHCFSRAAALYNGALVRTDDATVKLELNGKLKENEAFFLKNAVNTGCRPSLYDVDRGHKEAVQAMRDEVKQKLEFIDQQFNLQACHDVHRVVKKLEAQRADVIADMFVEIARSRKDFVRVLVNECMDVLGPAPCRYAVIGLGSQASETVTPYSDLEFAILLGEGCDAEEIKQYFRNLTYYLHIKVINLGETIIPAMAIKSLNDFESDNPADNWFYDSVTPRGFAFDGSMPWASKTPLGRGETKTKPALELIRTTGRMAQLQQESVAVAEGYHLSDILRNVCCLTGDDALVEEYRGIVHETLASTVRREGSCLFRAEDTLARDVKRYGKEGLTAKLLDVKKDIYRFPTTSMDSLCILCGIKQGSAWKVISDMEESGILIGENAEHLKVLVSISAELRLRTYLANGKQWETMSALSPIATDGQPDDHETAFKMVFYLPDDDVLFRYHYRAIPLERLLSGISNKKEYEPQDSLRSASLFDDSTEVKARICQKLLKVKEAVGHLEDAVTHQMKSAEPIKDFEVLDYLDEKILSNEKLARFLDDTGTGWFRLGDYRKACAYFEGAMRIKKALYGHDAHRDVAISLTYLGSVRLELGEYKEAIGYFKMALAMNEDIHGRDAVHPDIARSLRYLMDAWTRIGEFRTALNLGEQVFHIRKIMCKDTELNEDVADCLYMIGGALSNLGYDRKAIRYNEKALKTISAIYGNNTAHPGIAVALQQVGGSLIALGNHRQAVYYYERALKIWGIFLGEQTNQPRIAEALSDLGLAWSSTGDFTVSRKYHEQALNIWKALFGDHAHSGTARSVSNIGKTFSSEGKHREALQCHEEALAILKRVHGDSSNHPDIAGTLNKMGEASCEIGNYRRAKVSFERALAIFINRFGVSAKHRDIAMVLNNLGIVWRWLGDNRKSIEYYEQSLKMKEFILGHGNESRSVALTYCNIAIAYREIGEHKKAIEYNERALDVWRTTHGPKTPFIVQTLTNLATAWATLGDTTKAIRYNEEALEMCNAVYGPGKEHCSVANILENLGAEWNNIGKYKKALHYKELALKMNQSLYGGQANPAIATSQEHVAMILFRLGDNSKAVKYLNDTLESWTIVHEGRAHDKIATTLARLGTCWEVIGDNGKAISYYRKALDMLRDIHGRNSKDPTIVSLQQCLLRL